MLSILQPSNVTNKKFFFHPVVTCYHPPLYSTAILFVFVLVLRCVVNGEKIVVFVQYRFDCVVFLVDSVIAANEH